MDRIKSTEEIFGGRLLQEVEDSEESLESLLTTLTNKLTPHPPKTHIPSLDALWSQSYHNQPRLSVSGRQLPLLIHILTRLLRDEEEELGKCVVLIDVNGRFSPSFLVFEDNDGDEDEGEINEQVRKEIKLKRDDLKHLHVFRPSTENLECTLRGIEKYMLYGEHNSYGREFGGTILFGEWVECEGDGEAGGGDGVEGWRGG
ncbi:905ca7ed-4c84-453a-9761-6ec90ca2d10f-CDS [Sclerotinia trifoliorum]|uniref:905ca7ed-4c84-453a-9761-6ec90ca2d10f-CDS n=1 Tax=Sclerotinia trifoliorum TaxID=28548 RepID=A0A8H2VMU3_9HELO|nr:905ca7ed-4c84-453a-9761-6ec90ca2d10f-CDS [Sclerotinia trifoliorum]